MQIIIGNALLAFMCLQNTLCIVYISIPLEKSKRTDGRPESIHSVDSVNLDELINANYTADMEDETDLTDLANLDIIDDSTEDFWKVNQVNAVINVEVHV